MNEAGQDTSVLTPSDLDLEDVHNKEFELRADAFMIEETLRLAARKSELVESDCPACTSAQRTHAFDCHGFHYQKCDGCGTLYIAPCPTEAMILDFIENSEGMRIWRDDMPEETKQSRRPMYQQRLDDTIAAAAALGIDVKSALEVGGGSGEFAREVSKTGAFQHLFIVEPQPLELDLSGVSVVSGSFSDIDFKNEIDFVVAFEVFEHLVDPVAFLEMAHRSLRQGGILYMSMPSANGFEIQVLKEQSESVPFDHVRLYTPDGLRSVLERSGFEVFEITTPGKFDVEMVHRAYNDGRIDLADNPALRFMVTDGYGYRHEFQKFLAANQMSSHMRCIATKI